MARAVSTDSGDEITVSMWLARAEARFGNRERLEHGLGASQQRRQLPGQALLRTGPAPESVAIGELTSTITEYSRQPGGTR
jgi:hypothetical protein